MRRPNRNLATHASPEYRGSGSDRYLEVHSLEEPREVWERDPIREQQAHQGPQQPAQGPHQRCRGQRRLGSGPAGRAHRGAAHIDCGKIYHTGALCGRVGGRRRGRPRGRPRRLDTGARRL